MKENENINKNEKLPLWRRSIRKLFLLPVNIYRLIISPLLPPACIYHPSCSSYMVESVEKHGVFCGLSLGVARIFRCVGLFYSGGVDPVPTKCGLHEIKKGYHDFRHKK